MGGLTPDRVQTRYAFENAILAAMAIGGSTNAIVHLLAQARRARQPVTIDDFDRLSRKVPVLANVRPSGRYLMGDFYYAGGLRALLFRIRDRLHLGCLTVNGRTLGENLDGARAFDEDVIRPLDNPVYAEGGDRGAARQSRPRRLRDEARGVRFPLPGACRPRAVFDSYPDMKEAVDNEALDVTPDHVLVLRNAGPQGGPGMPEWGMLPIPRRLVRQGVRDMLRVSDARMSGTSYGACVLHVAPESFVGGPLALVRTGDVIAIDVAARRIDVQVPEDERARGRAAWSPPAPRYERGYGYMFGRHISQADQGCDFDFLERGFGAPVEEPAIF